MHFSGASNTNSSNSTNSENASAAALSGIQYPGIHDVLCGRGGHAMAHPGNLKYRTLIDSCKPRYDEATKFERSQLAANIVTMWRSQTPTGRFLTKTDPLKADSLWEDIGNKAALKKVSQTLRERRSFPMLSGFVQGHSSLKATQEPQPIVDAIITSAQEQEQLEKIRTIEEEIKQLQQQHRSQVHIEQQLRNQQIPQEQYPDLIKMPPPETDQPPEPQTTTPQPMDTSPDQPTVHNTPNSPTQTTSGRTLRSFSSSSSSHKNRNKLPPRAALMDKDRSAGSFSLTTIFDSDRQINIDCPSHHDLPDHNNSTSHRSSTTSQNMNHEGSSSAARKLMNESLGSISDHSSSRSGGMGGTLDSHHSQAHLRLRSSAS